MARMYIDCFSHPRAFQRAVQDLCVPGYSKKVRNVPAGMKREVYQEYGVTSHGPGDYEIDHSFHSNQRLQFNQKSLAGVPSDVALERSSKGMQQPTAFAREREFARSPRIRRSF